MLIFRLFKKKKDKVNDDSINIDNVEHVNGSVSSDTFVKTELTNEDINATKAARDEIENQKRKKIVLIKKIVIIVFIIALIIIIINAIINNNKKKAKTAEVMANVQKASIMNISSEISGSGTLEPKDSYTITSLVEGSITNVFFSLGDKVIKDQLLLTIDSSTAYRNITTASSSIAQALDTYNQAKYEYEKILNDYTGRTYKAPYAGSLRSFNVKVSDKLNSNSEIGTIVNDSIMTIKIPFAVKDVSNFTIGMPIVLELQETGELITGIIFGIAEDYETNSQGALVKYVTVKCANPGGLTTDYTAIGIVNGIRSISDANFELETNEKLVFSDGNDVEIEKLLVSEGAHVEKGTPLFLITEDSFNNVISNKKKTFLQAEEQLTKAENSYDDAIDEYDEYFITAPIDGTVITKDAKVGDKIQKSSSSAKTLATIYDLSELTFDMDIDELDISNITEGQEVRVQADAFNNKVFNGIITNVSLVAANSNGVNNNRYK